MLTDTEKTALNDVSEILGIPAGDLDKLISFESGWNPKAKNPFSSARGLIQFVDSTARDLGYTDSLDLVWRNPDRESQLRGPVLSYLKKYVPFDNRQRLAMSVFYPAFMTVPPDTVFPESVRKVNPGIETVSDYVNKVFGSNPTLPLAAIVALGILLFLTKGGRTWRNRRSGKKT